MSAATSRAARGSQESADESSEEESSSQAQKEPNAAADESDDDEVASSSEYETTTDASTAAAPAAAGDDAASTDDSAASDSDDSDGDEGTTTDDASTRSATNGAPKSAAAASVGKDPQREEASSSGEYEESDDDEPESEVTYLPIVSPPDAPARDVTGGGGGCRCCATAASGCAAASARVGAGAAAACAAVGAGGIVVCRGLARCLGSMGGCAATLARGCWDCAATTSGGVVAAARVSVPATTKSIGSATKSSFSATVEALAPHTDVAARHLKRYMLAVLGPDIVVVPEADAGRASTHGALEQMRRGELHGRDLLHSLSLLVPLTAMALPTLLAAGVYWLSGTTYYSEGSLPAAVAYTPSRTPWAEPLAAGSSLCFWLVAIALVVLPLYSRQRARAGTLSALLAYLLALLGAASWAFHADASEQRTWQHHAVQAATLSAVGVLAVEATRCTMAPIVRACAVDDGATIGSPSVSALVSLGAMAVVTFGLLSSDARTADYHGECDGALLLAGGAAVVLALLQRLQASFRQIDAQLAPDACTRLGLAMRIEGPAAATRAFVLGVGATLSGSSDAELLRAMVGEAAADGARLAEAERVEARTLHDLKHGAWHFLLAAFVLSLATTLADGGAEDERTAHGGDDSRRSDSRAGSPRPPPPPSPRAQEEGRVGTRGAQSEPEGGEDDGEEHWGEEEEEEEEEAEPRVKEDLALLSELATRDVARPRDPLREQASMLRLCSLSAWFAILCLGQSAIGSTLAVQLWLNTWLVAIVLVLPMQLVTLQSVVARSATTARRKVRVSRLEMA